MEFTIEDVVKVFNSVGFLSFEDAVQSLSLASSFYEAGFTDPAVLTPVLKRFKLINEQLQLKTQVAILRASQQSQLDKLVEETNPPIGELNNRLAEIEGELAALSL